MGGKVLEGRESWAQLVLRHTVEIERNLAQRDVADGPGRRPGEMTREEPLRRPGTEAADRDDARTDVVVVQVRERVEIDVAARKPHHVLGLAPREADRGQLVF